VTRPMPIRVKKKKPASDSKKQRGNVQQMTDVFLLCVSLYIVVSSRLFLRLLELQLVSSFLTICTHCNDCIVEKLALFHFVASPRESRVIM